MPKPSALVCQLWSERACLVVAADQRIGIYSLRFRLPVVPGSVLSIGERCRGRLGCSDQLWPLGFTCPGARNIIAWPDPVALFAGARLGIREGADHFFFSFGLRACQFG
jgi:hypothetical protein